MKQALKQVSIEAFTVIGPSVRTNNQAEASPAGKIPGLWGQFYASGPNLEGPSYGVYSDYESDASGDFTVTAGIRGEADSGAGIRIKAGSYLAFPANGPMPAAIIDAWKEVWAYFSEAQPYARAYETDFEQYNGPESATVYIGSKSAAS